MVRHNELQSSKGWESVLNEPKIAMRIKSNKKRTDKIVILSGSEFKPSGLRREWTEGDGKVHELVRLVADGNDPRVWIGDAARVVLLLRHVVNDVLLRVVFVRSGRVNWTDDVHLVVLERNVVLVHVDYVIRIVYPESTNKQTKETN